MSIIFRIFSTVLSVFAFLVISTTTSFAEGDTFDVYINDSSRKVVSIIHETAGEYQAPSGRYNEYVKYGVPLKFQNRNQKLYVNEFFRKGYEEYEYTAEWGVTLTAVNFIPLESGRYFTGASYCNGPRRLIVQLDNNQIFQTDYTNDQNSVYYITDAGISRIAIKGECDPALNDILSKVTHEPVNEYDSWYGNCR